jgi:hypothetical protein|tara:strand:+ start:136 stop:591 length:456 start_codon:yes stop_codon:yes gene_type:complete
MGYTTEFRGQFDLNKKLDDETHAFLVKFNQSRHVKRDIEGFGIEGEFFVDGEVDEWGVGGRQMSDATVVDYNRPPRTQPGLWCQWTPTDDRQGIEWDGNEKFYNYIEWIKYLTDKILEPKGYVLNGEVEWVGEEVFDDRGVIRIFDNYVRV